MTSQEKLKLYPTPKDYDKEIILRGYKGDYFYFVDSNHPLSAEGGGVIYHRHVISVKLNRWIELNEHVHHKDEDKKNNNPINLEIISNEEHGKLHIELKRKNILTKGVNTRIKKECKFCKKEFQGRRAQIYCSHCCYVRTITIKCPISKEELIQLYLEGGSNLISTRHNVSNGTVLKWYDEFEI